MDHHEYWPHPVPLAEQQRIMRDLSVAKKTALTEDDQARSFYLRGLRIK